MLNFEIVKHSRDSEGQMLRAGPVHLLICSSPIAASQGSETGLAENAIPIRGSYRVLILMAGANEDLTVAALRGRVVL